MPRPKKEQPNHAGGLYEIKITIGKTLEGKLIRKSFYSSISKADAKAQAEEWKVQQEVANRTGEVFVEKNCTFGEWAIKWLEKYKKPNVDENTYKMTYLNAVTNHLIPYFGKSNITNIRQIDIVNFYSSKKTLSESMLKKFQMCLNAIFESAIDNDVCYKNPAKSVGFTSGKDKLLKHVYTDVQIRAAEKYAYRNGMPEIVFLLETGLRRGELLGLKWNDIDFTQKTIHVARSVADIQGGGIKINPPKWGSFRTNPLSRKALLILKAIPRSSDYVFPGIDGNPRSPRTWSQKLKRFMTKMEANTSVPQLSAHELRHTYGTWLRRRGVDIYTIQKIMGHKDIKITSEIYVHNELESLKRAMKNSL